MILGYRVDHALLNFLLPYSTLYNVLNATCILVDHYVLDLLEYTHSWRHSSFGATQRTGLKMCVRLFNLQIGK